MSNCQACQAKSITFLCHRCIVDLRAKLMELPWWIARLEESATGQTRMGDGGRGSTREDALSRYTDPRHGDEKLERDLKAGNLLDKLLATGGINARASKLADKIHNSLGTWVRHLCEQRGVEEPRLVSSTQRAKWLAKNVNSIAADEGAGECVLDIASHRSDIERTINRPLPMRFLKCTTWDEGKRKECGNELRCRADVVEIRCPACRQTHNCDQLQMVMINNMATEQMTIKRILGLNRTLPEEYRVKERTLRWWIQHEKLLPSGINEQGEPLYLWDSVRKLKVEGSGRQRVTQS